MNGRTRPKYSSEFRLEAAQLVVNQGRSIHEAAEAMGVGKSNMDKWFRQFQQEHNDISPQATPDQIRIRSLKKGSREWRKKKKY